MNQQSKNTNDQRKSTNPNAGNFLKSMIKINNPSWTLEQIEQEFKRQMERNGDVDDGCIACSG